MANIVDLSGASNPRRIISPSQTFQDYLTINESPEDEAVITEHPVEMGAIMSDHIYLRPPTLHLRLGWSNADAGSTGASFVRDRYSQLLQLKNARQLFTVWTGKRIYFNMAVLSLRGPETDLRFEYAMIVDLVLRQILLVSTQSTGGGNLSTNSGANPDPSAQADPQSTQPAVDRGTVGTNSTNLEIPDFTSQLNAGTGTLPVLNPVGVPNSNAGGSGPVTTEPPT